MAEMDHTCGRFDGRVKTVAEWRGEHLPHLSAGADFTREPYPAHPSGTWSWLVCPCGAKLMTTGEHET